MNARRKNPNSIPEETTRSFSDLDLDVNKEFCCNGEITFENEEELEKFFSFAEDYRKNLDSKHKEIAKIAKEMAFQVDLLNKAVKKALEATNKNAHNWIDIESANSIIECYNEVMKFARYNAKKIGLSADYFNKASYLNLDKEWD